MLKPDLQLKLTGLFTSICQPRAVSGYDFFVLCSFLCLLFILYLLFLVATHFDLKSMEAHLALRGTSTINTASSLYMPCVNTFCLQRCEKTRKNKDVRDENTTFLLYACVLLLQKKIFVLYYNYGTFFFFLIKVIEDTVNTKQEHILPISFHLLRPCCKMFMPLTHAALCVLEFLENVE